MSLKLSSFLTGHFGLRASEILGKIFVTPAKSVVSLGQADGLDVKILSTEEVGF